MGKIKGTTIITGIVIAGLLASNVYTYMEIQEPKEELNEHKKTIVSLQEDLNVKVSQINQSLSHLSYREMVEMFNMYGMSNPIIFEGNEYYVNMYDVHSHSFKDGKYQADAEIVFLKDKVKEKNGVIQSELKIKLNQLYLDTVVKDYKESENQESLFGVGLVKTSSDNEVLELEQKAKKEFIIYSWNKDIVLNPNENPFVPTVEIEKSIMTKFIKEIILKEKKIDSERAEVKVSESIQTIDVNVDGKEFLFTYDKNTKELVEK